MAPRGSKAGSSGRNSTQDTNVKSKTSTRGRGGIQKRRAGPTRTDVDGDLDMGASRRTLTTADSNTSRSRPAGRSTNPRAPSRAAQVLTKHLGNGDSSLGSRLSASVSTRTTRSRATNAPLSFLRVYGLKQSKAVKNPNGGLDDLLGFLERKSSAFTHAAGTRKRQVTIKKSHQVGDYVFIGATKEDADELIKLNTFTFAGTPLEITESEDGLGHSGKATESKDTQELRTKLQTILSQRYNTDHKLLKLDALASDAELVNLGMFETRERALKTFKGLMAICDGLFKSPKAKQDAIESISLANNSIDDVAQVEAVATTFPQLKNLDISGNQISSSQAMDRWKGKFKELITIYTSGNPIETTDPNFQSTLLEWFPKLQDINGVQVRTAEEVAANAAAKFPKPILQHGPDFRDVAGIGEKFLLEFFSAYDSERQGLLAQLYDDDSQFSLAVDTNSLREPNTPAPLPWAPYIKASRNLLKINARHARSQRLFKGVEQIHELWKGLPLTRHPAIKENVSKYIMDCHPLSGLVDPAGMNEGGVDGLILSVHGEFEECDRQTQVTGMRSFSRSFILGPGQPGKGPFRVINDMLSLRAFSPLPDVFSQPNQVQPPTLAPTQPVDGQNQHQAMIVELSKQTGMTPQYSEMCLTQVGWDFAKGLVMFQEKKSQLPAEAFSAPS